MFKFDKLSVHLDANQAPISEDATCIISRIEYDPTTDNLVGFALPVDEKFLPSTDSYLATSFEQIEEIFRNDQGLLLHM